MGLVQVNRAVLSSAASSLAITGIDSDDVYMVTIKDLQPDSTNQVYPYMRFLESGTANTSANYDMAYKTLKAAVGFADYSLANNTGAVLLSEQIGTATQEKFNGIMYIYNANNSSEYTFYTLESTALDHNSNHLGSQGGSVLTVTSAVNGIDVILQGLANIKAGCELVLYKVT